MEIAIKLQSIGGGKSVSTFPNPPLHLPEVAPYWPNRDDAISDTCKTTSINSVMVRYSVKVTTEYDTYSAQKKSQSRSESVITIPSKLLISTSL
jgi:hypothetical protein